jgi:hypothetical protein
MSGGPPPRDPRAATQPPWHSAPPKLPLEIAPAAAGRLPQVRPEPGYEALAGFLESDLQGGLAGIDRLLEQLERVAAGGVGGYRRDGNAYSLCLMRPRALIRPRVEGGPPDCRIELALLRRALMAWRDALTGGSG